MFPNKRIYEGEFIHGEYAGYGTFSDPQRDWYFRGEISNEGEMTKGQFNSKVAVIEGSMLNGTLSGQA